MKEVIVSPDEAGQRLDNYLSKLFPKLSRSQMYKALRNKKIKVNRKRAQYNQLLQPEDHILLFLAPDLLETEQSVPLELPFPEIVKETDDFLIMNKPRGLLSQKDSSEKQDSLNGRLLWYLYKKGNYAPGTLSSFTPSVAHRLDRNTSGLVIAGKNARSARTAAGQIQSGDIKKKYLAITQGVPKEGHIDLYLKKDGTKALISERPKQDYQPASMNLKVLEVRDGLALVECELETGRFHQIRASLAHLGYPLYGDHKYGSTAEVPYALHAYQIDFSSSQIPLGSVEILPQWKGKAKLLLDQWLEKRRDPLQKSG